MAAHFDLDGYRCLAWLCGSLDLFVLSLDTCTIEDEFRLLGSGEIGGVFKGGETYTLPRLMISLTPVTGFCLIAAMGVCIFS